MSDKDDKVQSLETVPPPASGDAYSAETVQRVVPPELLAEAKRELLKRSPRSSPNKPVAAAPNPLAPAPLPVIDRIFDDEDVSDQAETVMRPQPREERKPSGSGPGLAVDAAPGRSVAVEPAEPAAPAERRRGDSSRRAPAINADGWLGSTLIFVGTLLIVLLAGALLTRLVQP
jgi:hypothetical protein